MASTIRGSNNFDSAWGNGQTWTNVTSSRTSGSTYTNSTGAPISISAISATGAYPSISLYVNGSLVANMNGGYHPGNGATVSVFGIVPNGATYRVDNFATFWELR